MQPDHKSFEVQGREENNFNSEGVGGGAPRYELYSNYRRVRGARSPTTCLSMFTDERDLILTQEGWGGGVNPSPP